MENKRRFRHNDTVLVALVGAKARARYFASNGYGEHIVELVDPIGECAAGGRMCVSADAVEPADSESATPFSTTKDDEEFARLLEQGPRWCRARLLRVLGQAAAQGVLDEVLGELLPETGDEVTEEMLRALTETGWMPPGARLVP